MKKRPDLITRNKSKKQRNAVSKSQRLDGNSNWRGYNASYRAIHKWIVDNWNNYKKCDYCGSSNAKIYDWANISGKYTRDKEDYLRMCRSCHIKLDRYNSLLIKKPFKIGTQP